MNNWQAKIQEDMSNGVLFVAHDAAGKTCAECGDTIHKPLDGLNYGHAEYTREGDQIGNEELFCNWQCLYRHYQNA